MSIAPKEIALKFKNYVAVGHDVFDLKGQKIQLGDKILNQKNNKEVIVDEKVLKTLDFGIEVLNQKKQMNNLLVIKTAEPQRSVIEFEEEEEEECFECEVTPKKAEANSKDLVSLKKIFDVVEVVEHENYNLLTIKDHSENKNIDWNIWIHTKVRKVSYTEYNTRSSQEFLNGAYKEINKWVEMLIKYKKEKKTNSLFAEDELEVDRLEEEPKRPEKSENWDRYWKELERVKKANIIKQYDFFEVANLYSSWFSAEEDIKMREFYINKLPKNDKKMIELLKQKITELTKDDRGAYGRFDDFWWDNSHGYIQQGDTLSDVELLSRAISLARMYLLPYKEYPCVYPDMSYTIHSDYKEKINYRCYFDGEEISGSWSVVYKKYNLLNDEFVKWLREWFQIQYKEPAEDKDVISSAIFKYYEEITENFNFIDLARSVKSEDEYIKIFNSKEVVKNFKNNSGGSLSLDDGYSGFVFYDNGKKDTLKIEQKTKVRKYLNRDCKEEGERFGYIEIFTAKSILDIHKKAFELHCDKEAIDKANNQGQGSLF